MHTHTQALTSPRKTTMFVFVTALPYELKLEFRVKQLRFLWTRCLVHKCVCTSVIEVVILTERERDIAKVL